MQSIFLESCDLKCINKMLYKYLWNKHFRAAKAPERLKREIINTPIELGGFGMLDIGELDDALKLRALGLMLKSEHPFLKLLKGKINLTDFFDPKFEGRIDSFTARAVELLKEDRTKALLSGRFQGNLKLIRLLKGSKIRTWVKGESKNSITLFNLWTRGIRNVRDLDRNTLDIITPILSSGKTREILGNSLAINVNGNVGIQERGMLELYPTRSQLKELALCTSREIRTNRKTTALICDFKVGMQLTPAVSKTWLFNLKRLTSTKHKNSLLRIAHGEFYSKARLFKFGLEDSPLCERCGVNETTQHRLFQCPGVSDIWKEVTKLTDKLLVTNNGNPDEITRNMGAFTEINTAALTLKAETLTKIMSLSTPNQINPETLARNLLSNLVRKESNSETKSILKNLLDGL